MTGPQVDDPDVLRARAVFAALLAECRRIGNGYDAGGGTATPWPRQRGDVTGVVDIGRGIAAQVQAAVDAAREGFDQITADLDAERRSRYGDSYQPVRVDR